MGKMCILIYICINETIGYFVCFGVFLFYKYSLMEIVLSVLKLFSTTTNLAWN